jgi:hypothetical protein
MTSILKADNIQDADGNNIINESGNTITIGASGDTISIPSGATIANSGTATGFGLVMVDQWRLTANLSISGNGTTAITANLERVDTNTPGFIGTAMSESSGVFTFPSTGIYKITSHWSVLASADSTFLRINNEITTDDGTYETATEAGISHAENGQYSSGSSAFTFDVTDTTTHKVRFRFRHNNSGNVLGSSTVSKTNFLFERLGDT